MVTVGYKGLNKIKDIAVSFRNIYALTPRIYFTKYTD